jgi:DHA2 family metal-tetracycline-proton antiporter-like MFS transporter
LTSGEGKVYEDSMPSSDRLFLAVVVTAVFVSVVAGTMVNVVVPVMGEDFGASEAQVGWVVTSHMLVFAVGVPLYGRISDFFSLRRLFSLGLLVFAVGSLVCAIAPSLPTLVFGRVVQAVGDAAIPALAGVAVAKVLPPGRRGGALGLILSSVGVGASVGPILGGFVEQFFGWHYLFYGVFVMALLLIPSSLKVLPGESGGIRRFDLLGGVLLGLAAGLFLFGVTQGQGEGFASASSWGSFVGAALSAALFAYRISSVQDPFVSPKLFGNRAYVAATLVGFFTMIANVAATVFVPLLVIEVNGLSPAEAGLVLTPGAVAIAMISPRAGKLSDRVGARVLVVVGLSVMGLALFLLSTFGAGASPILASLGMFGVGTGFALSNPATTNAAANSLPGEDVGVGLGIYQGVFFLGGGTGPALIGALLAARKEADVGALNPLYVLDATPFSDAFLALAFAVVLGLLAASGLRSGPEGQVDLED